MAEASGDSYAGARASLRDTLKWYVAALSGLGAALAAGLSLGLLPDLAPSYLKEGLGLGIAVLALILLGIWLVQGVLFLRPFPRSELEKSDTAERIAPYLREILPSDIDSLADLTAKLAAAEAAVPRNGEEVARLQLTRAKLVSFAALLDLQAQIRRVNTQLLMIFVLVVAGFAGLVWLQGLAKAEAAGKAVPVRFAPGAGWADYAQALAGACASGPEGELAAKGVADAPFPGWWKLTLSGPTCPGVVLTVPAAVVHPAAP